jgi:uncharacterized protein (DUF1778 family)
MAERKSEVVNLRMSPRVKELLRRAASHERRTLSNMLEVLIEDFCSSHHIELEQAERKSLQAAEPSRH